MAAEWAANAAANAAGNLATECLSPYINYFFRFGRNVEEFKDLRERLKSKIERLKDEVEEAVMQTEVIYEDVNRWLTRAEKELGEAQSMEDEIERCKCFSWCPSWGWRYCLSMKVSKKSICIKQLIEACNFGRLGQRPPLQGIEFLPSKDFKASQSSTVAFNAIIKALTTEGVNMIGLYGMPGVGKTTLAKEVGKYAGEQKLFDKVVMVTMSQTPSINNIQDRIAEILGLEFKAKTEKGKAEELWWRLKGGKILIIIDDVWKKFALDIIGISFGGENNLGCKVVLTTRIQSVCKEMNCEKEIKLEILAEDEAWALFKDIASPMDAKVIEVAKELAGECQGLPLAIKTVANALKNEDPEEWEAANQRLKDSRHSDNQRFVEEVYCCLELSYSYLKGENMKTCLLLCSLFPEDYDIPIDWLVLIGIGEGLFRNIELMETQRKEIRLLLKALQRSGLLLEINDERDTVRMHDVVRDFSHWLTSTRDIKFMVKEELAKWPMSENFESLTAIAIWKFNMHSFPDKIDFKNLKTLFLSKDVSDLEERYEVEYLFDDHFFAIPATFFEGMKALRVLWLQQVKFSLEALQFLTSLRALFLVDCKLKRETISSLISMEKLDILFVDDTDLSELFNVVGLPHLKYLSIGASTDRISWNRINFPPILLSRLTSLQELHVLGRNSINLWELSSLSCLTALSLCVSYDLPEGFVFKKVQSYYISVYYYINSHVRRQTSRTLEILEFSSSLSPFRELFCNVEKLMLKGVSGNRYIVSEGEAKELIELTSLDLKYCDDLECLIEPTKNLHHHAKEVKSLQSLKYVKIKHCRTLKFIFSLCIAHIPLHLQQLRVSHCDQLEQVFGFAKDHLQIVEQHQEENQWVLSNLINVELIHLPKLRFIWAGHTHPVNLSSLNTMIIQHCDKLAYLFSSSLAKTLVHLEHISIESCNDLEHLISTEIENGDALCWPKLSTVNIKKCHSLKDVFSITLAQGLPALKNIEIFGCPQLMGLFSMAKENYEFPLHLQFLKSQSFINFTDFSMRDYLVILPSLVKFKIEKENYRYHYCAEKHEEDWLDHFHLKDGELYKFMPLICSTENVILQSINDKNLVPNLKPEELNKLNSLVIDECEKLECLIDMMLVHDIVDQKLLLSNLRKLELCLLPEMKCFWKGPTRDDSLQSLKVLTIINCDGLKYVLSASLAQSMVQLQQLRIANCDQLEHIISESESDDEIGSHSGHDLRPFLPNLQDLYLRNLMNLSGFSSQNNPITLPFLNKLAVESCPRLVNFTIHKKVEFKNLQEVEFSNSGYEMININQPKRNSKNVDYTTILEIFEIEDAKLLSRVEILKLDEMHQLRGPIRIPMLPYLRTLRVWNCDGLKSLFSPMLARNLPQLTLLEMVNCIELEEIIDTTPASSSSAQAEARLPHISFPNLETIGIIRCHNLKSLFPISVIHSLSKIETIKISEATCLEQVFKYEAELDINQHDPNQKRIVLPASLQLFTLDCASSLSNLAPVGYHLLFPSSCYLQIEMCPKLTTSFSEDSNGVVHAITRNDVARGLENLKLISGWTVLTPYKEEEESEVVDG